MPVTKQPVNHVKSMSAAFRKLQVLPPDLQNLKVVIEFPKMTSTFPSYVNKGDSLQNSWPKCCI